MIQREVIQPSDPLDGQMRLLLEWTARRSDLVERIEENSFVVGNTAVYKFDCILKSGRTFVDGHGRDLCRLTAASKAVGEAIERLEMIQAFGRDSHNGYSLSVNGGDIQIDHSPLKLELPSRGLYSSNGWAVHFDRNSAIESALSEALERHILLYSYHKYGWSGFKQIQSGRLGEISLSSLISRESIAGFKAGMAVAKSPQFPGVTFGYLCDKSASISRSRKWEQAFYETYDSMRAYAARKSAGLNPFDERDAICRLSDHWLRKEGFIKLDDSRNDTFDQVHNSLSSSLIVRNLRNELDLPVDFYCAYAFGGDLIPLYFYEELSEGEKDLLLSQMVRWDLKPKIEEVHPVL